MTEVQKIQNEDGQKTLVAFVVGLLIGGLLTWAFSGPRDTKNTPDSKKTDTKEQVEVRKDDGSKDMDSTNSEGEDAPAKTLSVGEGSVTIEDQNASKSVVMESATYPVEEGWIAVRDYQNDVEGRVLGAVRFSKADGLVPTEIVLQRPTIAGQKYAISLYEETGNKAWGDDKKLEGIFGTFMAK
jgi:cytoskeletal protein RodZ